MMIAPITAGLFFLNRSKASRFGDWCEDLSPKGVFCVKLVYFRRIPFVLV